jgi:hypothetical protein
MTVVQIILTDEQIEAAAIASLRESFEIVDFMAGSSQSDEEKELIAALKLVLNFYGVKSDDN